MKKRWLSALVVVIMVVTFLPVLSLAATSVTYIDASGETKSVDTYSEINSGFSTLTWAGGWYVVSGNNVVIDDAVTLSDDVSLILRDGAMLTINKGIVGAKTLTVYGQSGGTGVLVINGGDGETDAGENGGNGISGNAVIYGGVVDLYGGAGSMAYDTDEAGIGTGGQGISGKLTVSGNAQVTVCGGNGGVNSYGCENNADGGNGCGADVTVSGNAKLNVLGGTASSGESESYAGNGGHGIAGNVTVNSGNAEVIVIGGNGGSSMMQRGVAGNGINGTLAVNGGKKINVVGGVGGSDGESGADGGFGVNGVVTISAGSNTVVEIRGGKGSQFCHGGSCGSGGAGVKSNVTVTGSCGVTITGGDGGQNPGKIGGIGGVGVTGNVTVSGSAETAIAGGNGIGDYNSYGVNGNVTVSENAKVTVTGGTSSEDRGGNGINGNLTVTDNGQATVNGGKGTYIFMNFGVSGEVTASDGAVVKITGSESTEGAGGSAAVNAITVTDGAQITLIGGTGSTENGKAFDNADNTKINATVQTSADGSTYTDWDKTTALNTYHYLKLLGPGQSQPHLHGTGTDVIQFEKEIKTFADLQNLFANGGSGYLAADITSTASLTVAEDVDLCLNDKVLNLNNKGNITVSSGKVFNLYDCGDTKRYYDKAIKTSPWKLKTDGTSDYITTGGVITGGGGVSGGAVGVYGTFNMSSGTIAGNISSSGGGVNVYGAFNMSGGAITGNATNTSATNAGGGGVYLNGNAAFNMTGNSIISENYSKSGAGVYCYMNSAFTMSENSQITGNTSNAYGGGVYVGGMFSMSGKSKIADNKAGSSGGGVYINGIGKFMMSGGSIVFNTTDANGGGVYDAGSISLGGAAKITDNIWNNRITSTTTIQNLYLPTGKTVILGKGSNGIQIPTSSMSVGITLKNKTGMFTDDNNADYSSLFIADAGADYKVINLADDSNKLKLVTKYSVTVDSGLTNGTVTTDASDNKAFERDTVNVTVKPNSGYQFKTLTVTTTDGGNPIATVQDPRNESNYSFTMPACPVTITAEFEKAPEPVAYKVIIGMNQTVFTNAESAKFASDADFSKFDHVEVDGSTVAKKYYNAESGSTVITFNKEFIKNLSLGDHRLTIVSTDGSASTVFTVKKPMPKTGDNTDPALLALLLIGSVGVILLISVKARKRKS